jgi:periplasmic protein TonB
MGELNGATKDKKAKAKAKAVSGRSAGAGPFRSSARRVVHNGPDPMSRVLAVGPRIPVAVTIAVAVFLHVGMAAGATAAALFDEIFAWQRGIRDVIAYRLSQYEMEVIKETPPPPPEEPKDEPKEEKPVIKENDPPPPPPQPAEAAKVLTAEADPNAPVDLTNSFVTGSGSTYAGGQTSSTGTNKTAVYNPAAANTGVVGGTGTGPAPAPGPPKQDRSRTAGLLGSGEWNCPWPGEADAEQIDQAFVMIQVKVKPDGSPENVSILQDPGHGFGREARKCAMGKKYNGALDADGNAIGGMTKPFRVRFER